MGNGQRALFYGLLYLVKNEDKEILEKIRVFRNLIQNSYIDSSNLKNAVESLKLLAEETIDNNFNELLKNKKIKAIDLEQRYEEALKLEFFEQYPKHKDIILKIENDTLFNGKIKDIFILLLLTTNETISNIGNDINETILNIGNYIDNDSGDLLKNEYDNIIKLFDNSKIDKLFNIYKDINTKVDDNGTIWWELLPYDFYNENENNISCIYYKKWDDLEYYKWKGKLILSFLWYISKKNEINDFQSWHRKIILEKIKSDTKKNKLTIENIPKKYILYLLSKDEEFMNYFEEDKQFQIYLDKNDELEEMLAGKKHKKYKKGDLIFRSYNLKPSKNDPCIVFRKIKLEEVFINFKIKL